ncbi:unnamed protein product [Owenia fusiformis]|uniref:Uncharacterized protein n=1 Tax=Owenia fusiformis TaxID=6347 RepID=A0A8S4PBD0_OWEFU|nr:unnamed protein product [Owenia fusiformis]
MEVSSMILVFVFITLSEVSCQTIPSNDFMDLGTNMCIGIGIEGLDGGISTLEECKQRCVNEITFVCWSIMHSVQDEVCFTASLYSGTTSRFSICIEGLLYFERIPENSREPSCTTNNDCTDPSRPNCRRNGAGIMICGDPHISQTIQGAHHRRLCYDFAGQPGSVYILFRDQEIDIRTTFVEDEDIDLGSVVDFIDQIVVKGESDHVAISPDEATLVTSKGERILNWREKTVKLDSGFMTINRKQIKLLFKNDTIELVITRRGRAKGAPFLNVGVTEKTGLSKTAGGIMGWIGNEAVFHDEGPHSGYITLGNVTIPAYDSRDGCLKIDDAYLNKFTSILQMFEMK